MEQVISPNRELELAQRIQEELTTFAGKVLSLKIMQTRLLGEPLPVFKPKRVGLEEGHKLNILGNAVEDAFSGTVRFFKRWKVAANRRAELAREEPFSSQVWQEIAGASRFYDAVRVADSKEPIPLEEYEKLGSLIREAIEDPSKRGNIGQVALPVLIENRFGRVKYAFVMFDVSMEDHWKAVPKEGDKYNRKLSTNEFVISIKPHGDEMAIVRGRHGARVYQTEVGSSYYDIECRLDSGVLQGADMTRIRFRNGFHMPALKGMKLVVNRYTRSIEMTGDVATLGVFQDKQKREDTVLGSLKDRTFGTQEVMVRSFLAKRYLGKERVAERFLKAFGKELFQFVKSWMGVE